MLTTLPNQKEPLYFEIECDACKSIYRYSIFVAPPKNSSTTELVKCKGCYSTLKITVEPDQL